MTPQVAQRLGTSVDTGAFVASVAASGPAAHSGLQANDVITAIDGKAIKDSSDLVTVTRGHQPGDKIQVTVVRRTTSMTVPVTLGSVPAIETP
jgi:serine protease Do